MDIKVKAKCSYSGKISVVIRLGQLYLLKILLCFLVTHSDVTTQRQESPVG